VSIVPHVASDRDYKKIRLREAVHQKDLTQSVFFQEKSGNHQAKRRGKKSHSPKPEGQEGMSQH
jgi:hypothetical protein